jgi:TonB family protein
VTTELALLVVRSSVLMALALVAVACLSRWSAAMRHRVLALAFCGAAVVGPLVSVVPEWPVLPAPPMALSSIPTSPAAAASAVSVAPEEAGSPVAAIGATASAATAASILWVLGAAVAFFRLAGGSWYVRRLASHGPAEVGGAWPSVLEQVRDGFGIGRPVRLAVTNREGLLATFGVMRPTVLIPRSAIGWSEDRVRVVLLHELAHVKRRDWLVQVLAESARAMFWFNPLFWIACARLRRESECACDDEVLAAGMRPDRYAEHLVEIARRNRHIQMPWAAVVPMARQSTLEGRVTAMLNPGLDRRTPSRLAAFVSSALVVATVIVAASLRLAAQGNALAVEGRVFDPSGGVLPGVEVTLEDGNKIKWPTTTDREGAFKFEPVGAGNYVLEASLPGFKSLRHEFVLAAGRRAPQNVTLQVGSLEETIRVTAKRPAPAAASQPGQQPARVRIGGNIKQPMKTLDVRPVYPESMRAAGLEGVVPMEAVIGVDGRVLFARVVSAQVAPEFAASAIAAVKQWQFTPTLLNGVPVEVQVAVSISFGLED